MLAVLLQELLKLAEARFDIPQDPVCFSNWVVCLHESAPRLPVGLRVADQQFGEEILLDLLKRDGLLLAGGWDHEAPNRHVFLEETPRQCLNSAGDILFEQERNLHAFLNSTFAE
jgi:hypothetical protein